MCWQKIIFQSRAVICVMQYACVYCTVQRVLQWISYHITCVMYWPTNSEKELYCNSNVLSILYCALVYTPKHSIPSSVLPVWQSQTNEIMTATVCNYPNKYMDLYATYLQRSSNPMYSSLWIFSMMSDMPTPPIYTAIKAKWIKFKI